MKTATYTGTNGKKFSVEYDENAPCRICEKPVCEASMGGTDVCPWCDNGVHRNGISWTYQEMVKLFGKKELDKVAPAVHC